MSFEAQKFLNFMMFNSSSFSFLIILLGSYQRNLPDSESGYVVYSPTPAGSAVGILEWRPGPDPGSWQWWAHGTG